MLSNFKDLFIKKYLNNEEIQNNNYDIETFALDAELEDNILQKDTLFIIQSLNNLYTSGILGWKSRNRKIKDKFFESPGNWLRLWNVNNNTIEIHTKLPSYDIISHVWGNKRYKNIIKDCPWEICLNKEELEKLRNILIELKCTFVWIDCLCINQESDNEKKELVPKMANIYAKAKNCFIFPWGCGSSEKVINDKKIAPWFFRAWTLQEAIKSRNLKFVEIVNGEIKLLSIIDCIFNCIEKSQSDIRWLRNNIVGLERVYGITIMLDGSAIKPIEILKEALKRESTLDEDRIYCCIGLLKDYMNISIEIKYGTTIENILNDILDKYPIFIQEFITLDNKIGYYKPTGIKNMISNNIIGYTTINSDINFQDKNNNILIKSNIISLTTKILLIDIKKCICNECKDNFYKIKSIVQIIQNYEIIRWSIVSTMWREKISNFTSKSNKINFRPNISNEILMNLVNTIFLESKKKCMALEILITPLKGIEIYKVKTLGGKNISNTLLCLEIEKKMYKIGVINVPNEFFQKSTKYHGMIV